MDYLSVLDISDEKAALNVWSPRDFPVTSAAEDSLWCYEVPTSIFLQFCNFVCLLVSDRNWTGAFCFWEVRQSLCTYIGTHVCHIHVTPEEHLHRISSNVLQTFSCTQGWTQFFLWAHKTHFYLVNVIAQEQLWGILSNLIQWFIQTCRWTITIRCKKVKVTLTSQNMFLVLWT